jgi:8-oxo-dGTP pyrophosphatase MutT (NUDIX family)
VLQTAETICPEQTLYTAPRGDGSTTNKSELKHSDLMPGFSRDRKKPPYVKEKSSVGVACCRIKDGKPEILLICKRYTYAYDSFVHGRYSSGKHSELIILFNGMTADEKLDIMSLNFKQIWYRVWLNSAQKMSNYMVAKNKFESTFCMDGGAKLKRLIGKSNINASRVWEVPKGRRKNKSEADIHAAIREFYEETGVAKKHYSLFPNQTKSYSYISDGTRYTNTYYLAYTRLMFSARIDFNHSSQLDEISDIKWMDIDAIRHVDISGRIESLVKPVFKYVKKQIKK